MADDFKAKGELKIDSNIPEVAKQIQELNQQIERLKSEIENLSKIDPAKMTDTQMDSYIAKGKEYEKLLKRMEDTIRKSAGETPRANTTTRSEEKKGTRTGPELSYALHDRGTGSSNPNENYAFQRARKMAQQAQKKGIFFSDKQLQELFEAVYNDDEAKRIVDELNATSPTKEYRKGKGNVSRKAFKTFISDEGEIIPSTYVDSSGKRQATQSIRVNSNKLRDMEDVLGVRSKRNPKGILPTTANGQSIFGLNNIYETLDTEIDNLIKQGKTQADYEVRKLKTFQQDIVNAIVESIANTDNEDLRQKALNAITGKKFGIVGEDYNPHAEYRRSGKLFSNLQARYDSAPSDFEAGILDEYKAKEDRYDVQKIAREDRKAAQQASEAQIQQDKAEKEMTSFIQTDMRAFITKAFKEGGQEGLADAVNSVLNQARDLSRGNKVEQQNGTVSLSAFSLGEDEGGQLITGKNFVYDEENSDKAIYIQDMLDDESKKMQAEAQETESMTSKAILSYREMLVSMISQLQDLQSTLPDFEQRSQVGSVIQTLQKRLGKSVSPNDKSVQTNIEEAANRLANFMTEFPVQDTAWRKYSQDTGIPYEEVVKQAMGYMDPAQQERVIRSQRANTLAGNAAGKYQEEILDLLSRMGSLNVDSAEYKQLAEQLAQVQDEQIKSVIRAVFGIADKELKEIEQQIKSFSGSSLTGDQWKQFSSLFMNQITKGARSANTQSRDEKIPTVMPTPSQMQGYFSPKERYMLGYGQGQMVMGAYGTKDPSVALERVNARIEELGKTSQASAEKIQKAQAIVAGIQSKYGTKTTKSGTKITWASAKGFGIGDNELSTDKRRYAYAQKVLRNSSDTAERELARLMQDRQALMDALERQKIARVGTETIQDEKGNLMSKPTAGSEKETENIARTTWGNQLVSVLQQVSQKMQSEVQQATTKVETETSQMADKIEAEVRNATTVVENEAKEPEVQAGGAGNNKIPPTIPVTGGIIPPDNVNFNIQNANVNIANGTVSKPTNSPTLMWGDEELDTSGNISEDNAQLKKEEIQNIVHSIVSELKPYLNSNNNTVEPGDNYSGNYGGGGNRFGGSGFSGDGDVLHGKAAQEVIQKYVNYKNEELRINKEIYDLESRLQNLERLDPSTEQEKNEVAYLKEQIEARQQLLELVKKEQNFNGYTDLYNDANEYMGRAARIGDNYLSPEMTEELDRRLELSNARNDVKRTDSAAKVSSKVVKDADKAVSDYLSKYKQILAAQDKLYALQVKENALDDSKKGMYTREIEAQRQLVQSLKEGFTYYRDSADELEGMKLTTEQIKQLNQGINTAQAQSQVSRASSYRQAQPKATVKATGMSSEDKTLANSYLSNYKQQLQLEREAQRAEQTANSATGQRRKEYEKLTQELREQLAILRSNAPILDEQNRTIAGQQVSEEAINYVLKQRQALDQNHVIQQQKITAQAKQQKGLTQQIAEGFKASFRNLTDYSLAYQTIGYLRQMVSTFIQTTKEMDKNIVSLQIATGESYAEIYDMMKDFNSLGQEMGRTTSDVAQAADDWLRAGYAAEEANQLIEASMNLSTLGQIDSADATSYLISMLKGWKMEVEDVTEVVDKLTAVDILAKSVLPLETWKKNCIEMLENLYDCLCYNIMMKYA